MGFSAHTLGFEFWKHTDRQGSDGSVMVGKSSSTFSPAASDGGEDGGAGKDAVVTALVLKSARGFQPLNVKNKGRGS